MHGLTSHHDAAMAMPESPMVMEHTDQAVLHVDPADEMPGMGGACLAILTGLVLLLALSLALRSLLVWRAVWVPAAGTWLAVSERSPPWRAPSLSSLGVLRI